MPGGWHACYPSQIAARNASELGAQGRDFRLRWGRVKRRAEEYAAGAETTRPASARSRARQRRNFVLDPLEPRILLSAEPISQALSDRLTEPADNSVAALFETLDETASGIDQGSGPIATIREGRHAAGGFGSASERTGSTGPDWVIDLGEEASGGGAGRDWVLDDRSSPGSEPDSEVGNHGSPGASSPGTDRTGGTGERLDVVAGDEAIDSVSEMAIDGSGEHETAYPDAKPSDPVSENLTPILPGETLAAGDAISEFVTQVVGYVEAHHVVAGPPADTRSESGILNAVESGTAGSRLILDDSLARGPPAGDDSPADGSRENQHGAPGSIEPSSGTNPEAGLLSLQERDLHKIVQAAINLWRSLGLSAELLDRCHE